MGLDNGLLIKKKDGTKIDFSIFPHELDSENFYEYNDNSMEVIYYRKCWGPRNEIIGKLMGPFDEEKYEYKVSFENLKEIYKIISHFNNKKVWENDGCSIWEYSEMRDKLDQDLTILEWLMDYMRAHDDLEVYFYDSY